MSVEVQQSGNKWVVYDSEKNTIRYFETEAEAQKAAGVKPKKGGWISE